MAMILRVYSISKSLRYSQHLQYKIAIFIDEFLFCRGASKNIQNIEIVFISQPSDIPKCDENEEIIAHAVPKNKTSRASRGEGAIGDSLMNKHFLIKN